MKILMLTPYLPYPPSDGGQVRSYALIKRLSRKHDITLVCFTRQHNTSKQVRHMEKFCRKILIFERGQAWTIPNILRTGFSLYPFLVNIYNSPEIRPALQKEISRGEYDLIHAETFYVMPYLPQTSLPTVLVEQTIMSRVFRHYIETDKRWWLKPLLAVDVTKIGYWEQYFWKKASRLVAVSQEDAQIMKKMVGQLRVDVVPNGVGEDFENIKPEIHYNRTILYMGNYKWIQNWEAAQILAMQVFPLIKKKVPEARLAIAGQFITDQVRSLSTKDIKIIELEDYDHQGVVDAYRKSGLLVAPIYGPGGTRLKILAAMASMVPVVTTPLGAEGYGAQDGKSILIGATPGEMAEKAALVLSDKSLYEGIATAAKLLVESKFTWGPITQHLESIYRDLTHAENK
jgi:glycosyltransferase involved in cell wall biosynthesis